MSGKSWPLVLSRSLEHERVLIGKFEDHLAFDSLQKPVFMYEDLEDDVKDEEKMDEGKGSEFYQRRRKRRFQRKSQIFLESAKKGTKEPVKYRGVPMEMKAEDTECKHVLLQVVRADKTSGKETEVHILPIDDWYRFKKCGKEKILSLDEIDMEYESLERQQKIAMKKYKKISTALDYNTKVYQETIVSRINKSSLEAESDGNAAPRAFGLGVSRGGKTSAKDHQVLGEADAVDAEEVGVEDGDEAGDEYQEVVSDDEEDALHEQAEIIDKLDRFVEVVGSSPVEEAEDDSEDEERDGDSDEDEDNPESDELATAGKELKGYLMKEKEKEEAAAKAGESKQAVSGTDPSSVSAPSGSPSSPSLSPASTGAKKRDREDAGSSKTSSSHGEDSATKKAKSTSSPSVQAAQAELTEESVRSYITVMGGRVKFKDLGNAFARQIKKLGEIGKQRYVLYMPFDGSDATDTLQINTLSPPHVGVIVMSQIQVNRVVPHNCGRGSCAWEGACDKAVDR